MKTFLSLVAISCVLLFCEGRRKLIKSKTFEENKELISGSLADFSFDMFGNISERMEYDNNVAFSPLSLYTVFSIMLQGLDGQSHTQVEKFLHLDALNMRKPAVHLSKLGRIVFAKSKTYRLEKANRIFVDYHFPLLADFKELLMEKTPVLIKDVGFKSNPNGARRKINKFVARRTHDMIPELLKDGSLSRDTKMIILNVIFLEAKWEYPFMKNLPRPMIEPFHINEHESINIEYMHGKQVLCIRRDSDTLQAKLLALPFEGGNLEMVIFMPHDAGNFSKFTQPMSSMLVKMELDGIRGNKGVRWRKGLCNLKFPKFNISHRLEDLKSLLQSMGVVDIFDANSGNFSRMSSQEEIFVHDVFHQTVLEVNENGVKAAASSAILTGARSSFPNLDINKPFLFMIRHIGTGSILFLGRLVRPDDS